ncbi:MAG TPA: glycosyltransferase [Steroidobacteraceae bacterium]|nr:glycosyltransferase [Steroidobacteraceae bacterium]
MKLLIEIAIACLITGWLIYPIFVYAVGRFCDARVGGAESSAAGVSLLIATRDPVELVQARISNIQAYRHEVRLLEIIVAVDYMALNRTEQYRGVLGDQVRLVTGDAPGGKAATLNAAVRAARGDVLIFADSAQQFLPGAMKALVERLREVKVGASTGVLQVANNSKSAFLWGFWAYELWLRKSESRAASIVAVTGAIYALRRDLWEPLPAGLICDDLCVPLRVIRRGYRVVSCETAVALDPRSFGPRHELNRKVRTLTGMLQMCVLFPWILNPWKNRAWLQFVFHKLLRIVTPALMAIALGAALASMPLALRLGIGGVAVGSVVILLLLGRRVGIAAKLLRQIGWSLLFLGAPCVAVANAVRGKWDIWSSPGVERPNRSSTTV